MAAEVPVPAVGMAALCAAMGCAEILKLAIHFLEGSPARGPVLDAAVLLVVLTVVMAYLAGVILLYLHVTCAAGTPVVLPAFRQFVLLLCALLLFVSSLFHAAGGCCCCFSGNENDEYLGTEEVKANRVKASICKKGRCWHVADEARACGVPFSGIHPSPAWGTDVWTTPAAGEPAAVV